MLQTSVRGCNRYDAEIGSQASEFPSMAGMGYQRIAIFLIQVRQGPRDIADVGADPEVANPADIDDDMERHRIPCAAARPLASSRVYRAAAAASLQAYSGNCPVSAETLRRTSACTVSSETFSRTRVINAPTSRISGSRKPRVVTAGLPNRMPLGFSGGVSSA